MDWITLAKEIGIPAATMIGGWVSAAFNFRKRLEKIEKDYRTTLRGWQATDASRAKKLERIERELTQVRNDLTALRNELKRELEALGAELDELRADTNQFADDEEVAAHMRAQQDRWEVVQRTLGQIEGMLKAGGGKW